jgi:hypothetical protein
VQCNSGPFFSSTIPCIRACIANILGSYLGWAPGGRTCCPGPEPALVVPRMEVICRVSPARMLGRFVWASGVNMSGSLSERPTHRFSSGERRRLVEIRRTTAGAGCCPLSTSPLQFMARGARLSSTASCVAPSPPTAARRSTQGSGAALHGSWGRLIW